jgi:hypothetical protein
MRPAISSDLPLIVLFASVSDSKHIGLNRFIRSGDALVQTTSIIPVKSSEDTFSQSLQRLRLSPLPLRKRPSATEELFSAQDVQITNVSLQNSPVAYRMVANPSRPDEYRIDLVRAEVFFGESQKENDQLQVSHWTVSWHDEIFGLRATGEVTAEVWTDSFITADEISRGMQRRTQRDLDLLRQKGFLRLVPALVGPIERHLHSPPSVAPFQVWKQALTYRFTFEIEEGGEISSGIPINRIDVDMRGAQREKFNVPLSTHS